MYRGHAPSDRHDRGSPHGDLGAPARGPARSRHRRRLATARRRRRQREHAESRGHRARGKVDRRRPARAAAASSSDRACRRPDLARGAEEPEGAEAGEAGARGGRRARLRLGRGRDGAALRRRARLEGAARDHPGGHGQPVRVEPRDPAGHRAGGADRPARAPAQARRRAHERRALRSDGGRGLRRAR